MRGGELNTLLRLSVRRRELESQAFGTKNVLTDVAPKPVVQVWESRQQSPRDGEKGVSTYEMTLFPGAQSRAEYGKERRKVCIPEIDVAYIHAK